MIFGSILAGGIGKRVIGIDQPKQFACLNGLPVIMYSIHTMLEIKQIDEIIIAVHSDWMKYMSDLLQTYLKPEQIKRIKMISGGKERLDSFFNVIKFILEEKDLAADDIIICHEAARPFASKKMFEDCIELALRDKISATFLPVNDTIFIKDGCGSIISNEERTNRMLGQTPSCFNIKFLLEVYEQTSEEEKKSATSTTQLFLAKGFSIPIVNGSTENIKITTRADIMLAEAYLNRKGE